MFLEDDEDDEEEDEIARRLTKIRLGMRADGNTSDDEANESTNNDEDEVSEASDDEATVTD
jgi:hypothetical protein